MSLKGTSVKILGPFRRLLQRSQGIPVIRRSWWNEVTAVHSIAFNFPRAPATFAGCPFSARWGRVKYYRRSLPSLRFPDDSIRSSGDGDAELSPRDRLELARLLIPNRWLSVAAVTTMTAMMIARVKFRAIPGDSGLRGNEGTRGAQPATTI